MNPIFQYNRNLRDFITKDRISFFSFELKIVLGIGLPKSPLRSIIVPIRSLEKTINLTNLVSNNFSVKENFWLPENQGGPTVAATQLTLRSLSFTVG